MGRHRKTSQPASNQNDPAGTRPVSVWRAGEAVLVDGSATMTAEPGSHLRSLPCIACGEPVAGHPFLIHHVVTTDLCTSGYPHLAGMAVLRHASCANLDDNSLVRRIASTCPCTTYVFT